MPAMTALAPFEADVDPRRVPLDVEIVVPVYNEAAQLADRITALRTFLDESFPFRTLVTVVDNASTDDTDRVARRAGRHHARRGRHAPAPQGPRATRCVPRGRPATRPWSPTWTSTSRRPCPRCCLWWPRCCRGTATSRSARGWRPGAHVVRGPKRELISRAYNLLLKLTLRGPLQRCPVRLQGPAPRRGGEAAPARRGQRVVLRHRAARHGRAPGPAHRRGPGGLGRRP